MNIMYLKNFSNALLCMAAMSITFSLAAQQPAFPEAEGGGRFATGGRGGTVYEVTNLNDAGAGSLRDAISVANRTVVFRVSGIIHLASKLTFRKDNITVAGQTAPGDGIMLTGYTVNISASNIILRYLRCRLSDVNDVVDDAMNSFSGNYHDIIIDHCSLGWSVDETGTFYDIANFTLQWCILTESLYHSVHNKGDHGYGGIWGGNNSTFHHNLLAHHTSRNPRFGGSRYTGKPAEEVVDFRNNVLYNWGNINSVYGGEGGNYNMVNNYYKPGPATPGSLTVSSASNKRNRILNYTSYYYATDAAVYPDTLFGGKFYIDGNYVEGYPDVTANNWTKGVQKDSYAKADSLIAAAKQPAPFATAPVNTETAQQAYQSVLNKAGAMLPRRDTLDRRTIREARTGTATFEGATYALVTGTGISHPSGIIDTQADVGGLPDYNSTAAPADTDHDGMPDAWESANGLDPLNAADRNTTGPDGYTMLEKYLNAIGNDQSILPEGILSFSASLKQGALADVSLVWSVSDETGISRFEAERSTDGKNFTAIASFNVSTASHQYAYEDLTATAATVFYRLKMLYGNGTFRYSNIILIKTNHAGTFAAYPNPATAVIMVTYGKVSAGATLDIVSRDGKVIRTQQLGINTVQTSVDVSGLPPGTYTLYIRNQKAGVQFVKQ